MKRRQVAVRRRASTLRALSLVACAAVLAAAALAAHRARTQGQPARTQSQLLQDGIHKMEDNGDYRGAVRDLEQASQGRDRQIAALALLYLGDAEQHLGTAEARAAYEKIIREFEDQGLIVAQARERLARLDALKLKPSPRSETTRRLWRIGEFLALGPPSFDGRWMPGCVRNQKLGSWEPAVSDVRSLQVRHLAPALADENVNTVLFSPDGSQVAALWRLPSNSSPFRYEIRVYPAAGGSSRTVSTHDQVLGDAHLAGWTADGKGVIVCLAREGATREFAQVDVATGRPKTIARVDTITDLFGESGQLGLTAPLLAMSPDGRFVAYAPLHPGQTDYDIDVLDVTTGLAHTLVGGPANDVFPLWAADGRLLFMSDREGKTDLWLVEIEDGRTRGAPQIARRDSAMRVPVALSASGSLYYRAEDGRTNVAISTLDPKRGVATVPAVVGRLQGVNRIPDWSPDGRWLAYTSDSGIAFAQQSAVLVILDAKTGDERVVRTESPNLGPIPRWSLDGRSVTLLAATPNEARFTRVDVETGAAETFAVMQKAGSQVTAFEWTPDGRAVVYARGFRAVMRFDVESRCEQTLYEAPEGLRLNKPVLSHDGTRVAVVEWGETVNEQVVLVPLDGGAVRTLFTARPGYWADVAGWDPDDNVFVVTRKMPAGPAALLRVPASGGPPLPTGLEAPDIVHPRVSRDGLHFAFTYGGLSLAQYVLENFLPPRKAPVSGDARR
jgi:Tol biopolymer transport system component